MTGRRRSGNIVDRRSIGTGGKLGIGGGIVGVIIVVAITLFSGGRHRRCARQHHGQWRTLASVCLTEL